MTPKVRLIVLDVDGVLTDGRKLYGPDGAVIAKQFCDRDFTAIKRLRASGVEVAWLSGDRAVNEAMAERRNIPFWYAGDFSDKAAALLEICRYYAVEPADTVGVGDDWFDRPLLQTVGWPFCPADALPELKGLCGSRGGCALGVPGGAGVVVELREVLKREGLLPGPATEEAVRALDRAERR